MLFIKNVTGTELIFIKNIIGSLSLILGLLCLIFGDGLVALLLIKNKKFRLKTILAFNNCSYNYNKNSFLYDIARESCNAIDFTAVNKEQLYETEIQYNLICNYIIEGETEYPDVVNINIEKLISDKGKVKILFKELVEYIHIVIIYLILVKKDYSLAKELFEFCLSKENKLKQDHYLMKRSKYFLGYDVSLQDIMDELDNNSQYAISESYYNLQKNIILKK